MGSIERRPGGQRRRRSTIIRSTASPSSCPGTSAASSIAKTPRSPQPDAAAFGSRLRCQGAGANCSQRTQSLLFSGQRDGVSKRALLLCFDDWYSPARLPEALSLAGFEVGVVSEPQILVCRSRHVVRHFFFDLPALFRGNLASITTACMDFQPDIIVPCDERAKRVLHFIWGATNFSDASGMRKIVARSIGTFRRGGHGGERQTTLDLVERLGIATPPHGPARTFRGVLDFIERHGMPLYIKLDHTFAGQGVRFCTDRDTAKIAYDEFSRDSRIYTMRGLCRRMRRHYRTIRYGCDPLALPIGTHGIGVERAIPGTPAFYTGVALDGRVLAGFAADVLEFEQPNGPSTRVRLHHDREMTYAAARVVDAMGYAGFFGLDFMRHPEGNLVVLEFNGRPTTTSHLGHLVSADLCNALFTAIVGHSTQVPETTDKDGAPLEAKVAFFPQDWIRDPAGVDRHQFALDIPTDDPPLLEALKGRIPSSARLAGIDALSRQD